MARHLLKSREENRGSALKCLIDIPDIIEEVIHRWYTSIMLSQTQTLMLSVLFHDPGIRLDDNITATASALLTQNIMIHAIKIWTSPIHDKLLFKMHIWNSSGQLFVVWIRNYILFWNLKLEWYNFDNWCNGHSCLLY